MSELSPETHWERSRVRGDPSPVLDGPDEEYDRPNPDGVDVGGGLTDPDAANDALTSLPRETGTATARAADVDPRTETDRPEESGTDTGDPCGGLRRSPDRPDDAVVRPAHGPRSPEPATATPGGVVERNEKLGRDRGTFVRGRVGVTRNRSDFECIERAIGGRVTVGERVGPEPSPEDRAAE